MLLSREQPVRPGTEDCFFDDDESTADIFAADEQERDNETADLAATVLQLKAEVSRLRDQLAQEAALREK